MSERRYTEEEIAEIFQRAAQEYGRDPSGTRREGLTLAEMKEIGRDVGIPPEFIHRAAASVGTSLTTLPVKKVLGVPITVGKSVDLPGEFTDSDWNALVFDLHDTFHKPGEISTDGTRRRWRIGNLNAWVEPTETGHRLRMRSLNEMKRTGLLMGGLFFLLGLVFMALVFAKAGSAQFDDLLFTLLFAAGGLTSFSWAAFQLPRWREERLAQMEAIGQRAIERATKKSVTDQVQVASDTQSVASHEKRISLDDSDYLADESEGTKTAGRDRI